MDARRIFWGSVGLGSLIVGAAILAAASVDHAVERLLGWGGLFVIGTVGLSLVCWAIRMSRGDGQGPAFARLPKHMTTIVGLYLLAFLMAAPLLLLAWLAAWLLGNGSAPMLLQAFVLTLLAFVAGRICFLCIANMILVFRKPASEPTAQ